VVAGRSDRQPIDTTRLVVAKPSRVGRGYAAGERFRGDREAISERRIRQFVNQGTLVTDEQWRRRTGRRASDWIESLTRDELFDRLREAGHTPGPNTGNSTLRQRLREAQP